MPSSLGNPVVVVGSLLLLAPACAFVPATLQPRPPCTMAARRGWAPPLRSASEDGEGGAGASPAAAAAAPADPGAIMSDDPMIIKLEAECARLNGRAWNSELGLTQLLNPSKVVNLERELTGLRATLEAGVDDEAERTKLEAVINAKETKQSMEMRSVMRDWLKAIFVWQSVFSVVVCGLVAYDTVPGFPNLNFAVRVLGFWGIWLFTIPSLRSRKPGGTWGMSGEEKKALDISFLVTPLVNLAMPFVTKSPPDIFWANVVTIATCYAYGFGVGAEDGDSEDASLPAPIKFVLKAMDFGGGRERGASMEQRVAMFEEAAQAPPADAPTSDRP